MVAKPVLPFQLPPLVKVREYSSSAIRAVLSSSHDSSNGVLLAKRSAKLARCFPSWITVLRMARRQSAGVSVAVATRA